ncbi:MAG: RNA polymerase sigma factor [Acidobacteriia bacterium]|nr:RNA polymerase sigma factor [Terriglobia bacterium]
MAARKPAESIARTDTDERLLVEAAQKDPAKFGDLYELHFEKIYAFIGRRVRDRDTAEELTSEVFHRALANLRSYEWRGAPFGAWLMRIAANVVADRSKRDAREVPAIEDPPEPNAAPDLEALENRARLFRLVRQLPDDQRRVVHQRFVDEMSIREIAQQLGRSEGAVKQLQFRALQSLRAQMGGSRG